MANPRRAVYLGLGANIDDPVAQLQRAVRTLHTESGVTACSPMYRSVAVGGPPDQPDYFNAVVVVASDAPPSGLLRLCRTLERRAGRVRDQHHGPRSLDVDVLLIGAEAIDTAQLTVPHPLLHRRRFVLDPLCDLAGDLIHPLLQRSMAALRAALLDDGDAFQAVERVDHADWPPV